jgi:hypothetical protein
MWIKSKNLLLPDVVESVVVGVVGVVVAGVVLVNTIPVVVHYQQS